MIHRMCYSACRTALATGGDDCVVRIWDARGLGACLNMLKVSVQSLSGQRTVQEPRNRPSHFRLIGRRFLISNTRNEICCWPVENLPPQPLSSLRLGTKPTAWRAETRKCSLLDKNEAILRSYFNTVLSVSFKRTADDRQMQDTSRASSGSWVCVEPSATSDKMVNNSGHYDSGCT